MAEEKPTELPKSSLSFAFLLLRTWWTLVPVGILSVYGTITGLVKGLGSPQLKTQWDSFSPISRFGWQAWMVAALSSLIVVIVERAHQMLLSQEDEISKLRRAEKKEPFLEMLSAKQRLEEQIADLEKNLPENVGISVRPQIKVGKDSEDYLREQIARKKANLKEIQDRMTR